METKAGSALELDNSSGSGSSTQNLKPDQGKRTNQNNGSTDIMERTVICQDENRIDPSREYEDTSYSMQPQAEKLRPNEHTLDKGNNTYQGSPCSGSDILYCTVPSLGYLLKQEERRLYNKYLSWDISNDSFRKKFSVEQNIKPDYGGQDFLMPDRHYEQANDLLMSKSRNPNLQRSQVNFDRLQQSNFWGWSLFSSNLVAVDSFPSPREQGISSNTWKRRCYNCRTGNHYAQECPGAYQC